MQTRKPLTPLCLGCQRSWDRDPQVTSGRLSDLQKYLGDNVAKTQDPNVIGTWTTGEKKIKKSFCVKFVGFKERTSLLDLASNHVFVRNTNAENGEDEPTNRSRFPHPAVPRRETVVQPACLWSHGGRGQKGLEALVSIGY